jgi:hypothetical protein
MKATDIIRDVLDLIDRIECVSDSEPSAVADIQTGVDTNRFKHIYDLLSAERAQTYSNTPGEAVANIDAVTVDAGGGWNGPKNPADIKADSISMYPNYLAKPGA